MIVYSGHDKAVRLAQAHADLTGFAQLVYEYAGFWHVVPVLSTEGWPANAQLFVPTVAQAITPAEFEALMNAEA